MEEKKLINEIQRNLKIMGLGKTVRIYENKETKYRIVLKEGLGSIGSEIAQWLSRTGRQVFEEVPGILDQYGNKVTKMFFEIGNYKVADDVFAAFQSVCSGAKKLSDLGAENARIFLDIVYELNPGLITKFYDDIIKDASQAAGVSTDDIVNALRRKVAEGADFDDEVLQMCGGDELLANVMKREFAKKMNEITFVPFRGTIEDSIRNAFSWKWSGIVDRLPIDKTVVKGLKNFLASDGWVRNFRALLLQQIQAWSKGQDELLMEGLDNLQVIMTEILNGSKKDLSTQFRKLNITMDSVDPNNIKLIQDTFISEIKKLDFNVGGQTRKLTETEIQAIKDGLVNNKVFGEDIGMWVVEAWNKSYYGKWASELFTKDTTKWNSAFKRFFWWSFTSTARKGSDWAKILRTKTFWKEMKDIWVVTTITMKIVYPAVYAFVWGLGQLWNSYSETGNPSDNSWIGEVADKFMDQLGSAWAPTESTAQNILEIVIPIHGIPAVKVYEYFKKVRSDEVNVDDVIDRLRERYPEITDEEIQRYKDWWERNKDVNLNLDDAKENLDNLGSTENGFKAYCELKNYDFLGFNPNTEIGTATVPGQGAKKFEWDDDLNDFKQRN